MNEKLLAGIVAAIAIIPICATCILGPVVLGSIFVGLFGWIADINPILTAGAVFAAAIVVYGMLRRRRERTSGYEDVESTERP